MELRRDALEETKAELLEVYAAHARALFARDAALLASHYSDDAVILAPGAGVVSGADAVRAYCEGLCSLPYRFELSDFSIEHLLLSGEYVIEVSRFMSSSTHLSDGSATQHVHGKQLVLWRRHGAGWRIVRDMYNEITM